MCSFSPVQRSGYRLGVPTAGQYTRVFSSDEPAFGGAGLGDAAPVKTEYVSSHGREQSLVLDVPPMSMLVYQCTHRFPDRKKTGEKALAVREKAAKPAVKKAASKSVVKKAAAKKPPVKKTVVKTRPIQK